MFVSPFPESSRDRNNELAYLNEEQCESSLATKRKHRMKNGRGREREDRMECTHTHTLTHTHQFLRYVSCLRVPF